MFNVGDKVTVDISKVPYLAHDTRLRIGNQIGTIERCELRIHDGSDDPLTEYIVSFSDSQIAVRIISDLALQLIGRDPVLTLTDIHELKEKLTIDLLELIQDYEEKTDTHIATIHLNTTEYNNLQRVIGIRLEVQL